MSDENDDVQPEAEPVRASEPEPVAAPASAGRLARFVHLTHPENGERFVFGPDDVLPEWAAERITNPKAFVPEPEAEVPAVPALAVESETPLNKAALYDLDKDALLAMNEAAGIEASMRDSKKTLVDNLLARG